MIIDSQIPQRFLTIIEQQIEIYNNGTSVQRMNTIPDTSQIPIENPAHWLQIPDVISIFVDMVGSTKLSAQQHDRSTSSIYQLFTGTAVRLFHEFEAPYIDVRGDGVFALYNSNQPYRAIASAVSFKTFVEEEFKPRIKKKTGLDVGCHIGGDQKTVLVKKLGLKRKNGRTDRQNEVWAGKPINMSAKLASLAKDGELILSDRLYSKVNNRLVRFSCGCPGGEKKALWAEVDLQDDKNYDFDHGYLLKSYWCSEHGAEYCQSIMDLDE